ncbi:DNA polymerase III subunit delta' [Candidatus Palibaumannia cicadellinicola]|uniref:DNA polymerase III subunit delta' n=1 Tax=Candidatus Palibaumannia cicadellinicola TaxID=186490 RepID=A0A2N4XXF7_9GAMM|nr:DNA polymerase III subunit delta' [Candidatus Baumannia cicadellinicola]PLK59073.1 DNA polymerase III subunit delta' [Candidatus Baumannia cicadellinicola]
MILYPWLESDYLNILTRYQQGKGHHALLLYSPKGNGKASLFQALSRWLICLQPNTIRNCGQCHSCQLMNAGNHPDYYQLELEKGQQSIGVETIRVFIESLYSHARQGGAKVISLSHIELLTKQGVNALLKIIEEPPNNTYFLLGCRDKSCLLPTLLSRCLCWQLSYPDEALGLSWLQQQKNTYPSLAASTALRLCGGAPLAALALLQPACWKQRIALCMAMSEALHCSDWLTLLPLLNGHNHKDNNNGPMHWLLTILIDALKWQQGAQDFVVNVDQTHLVTAVAARWDSMTLHHQVQQWLNCRRKTTEVSGINRQLLLAYQLLNWELDMSDLYTNISTL